MQDTNVITNAEMNTQSEETHVCSCNPPKKLEGYTGAVFTVTVQGDEELHSLDKRFYYDLNEELQVIDYEKDKALIGTPILLVSECGGNCKCGKADSTLASAAEPTKEILDASVENANDTYTPNDFSDIPDFDIVKIEEAINSAPYLELNIWKSKLESSKKNLEDTRGYIEMYQSIHGRGMKGIAEELEVVNGMKKEGINMEMQLKSFNEKFEVNLNYLTQALERIQTRLDSERESVENSTTSVKTDMLIQMIDRNLESVSPDNANSAKAIQFFHGMREVYSQRDSVRWLWHKRETGMSSKATMTQFIRFKKGGKTVADALMEVFGVNYVPPIPGLSNDEREFFIFYLTSISRISTDVKKNIKARIIKERALSCLQNLGDCANNLFDYTTFNIHNLDGQELITYATNVYLENVREFAQKIYSEAKFK